MRGLVKESVHTAVIALENRIQALTDQRTNPNLDAEGKATLDVEIEQAQRALTHYRAALHYEEELLAGDNESPGAIDV